MQRQVESGEVLQFTSSVIPFRRPQEKFPGTTWLFRFALCAHHRIENGKSFLGQQVEYVYLRMCGNILCVYVYVYGGDERERESARGAAQEKMACRSPL